ncbi:methylcrotonoyl-CoA carboxylase [Sphingomonas sp. Leaf407]|uniref:acetyl/propionyl/methylcrotonyl-CoA carboxylase subunit alpha n=1 Tax=unclassified Sphingomonas TaxID=196159 RepID=UPI0006F89EFD|nr:MULTISPECIES: biotin carboxylase N-terminal domain-containing protein [unclassified Sphingomonas]KQN36690.1 methylcrotonoyl-CoA carboxylase [Sphingomonas sp. Leaf42]KQT27312.1 methylcrotonoyl-CoA carboxylase [Sphingomonas sp. Leaf407]
MIDSVLIANRGEIACRIIRTARAMGVRTIAVHSDADAGARHVAMADAAIAIGPAAARDSYLNTDRILAAARASGAAAIHPGYGFLSENADFAQAVIDAGLVWIGPRPDSIRAMGLKDAAKARMIAAGVPVTPGYQGADQSPERLEAEAATTGYPILIKAVAGGGGKGMRRVDDPTDFLGALESCRREAAASFGDDRVLIEKYILSPRHIEVQVFGDTHGKIVHLFERDCSLQRRHQKVIEEAPAPGMDDATRASVCAAAVQAARAVDYVGAGTIEFIADASHGLRADRIWFMEMNTRLQVEHPVTEAITGVDLVEWQLRVASGEPLPLAQDELSINGWAMEARLYAENPATGFLPSTGRLDRLALPDTIRVDTGVREGDVVTPHYDPMIAKLIVHAPDRHDAAARLAQAAGSVRVWPVRTNAGFLARAAAHPDFVAGHVDTGFIERHLATLVPGDTPPLVVQQAAAAALLPPANAPLAGFRLNAPVQCDVSVEIGGAIVRVTPQPADAVVIDSGIAYHGGEGWSFGHPRSDRFVGGAGTASGTIVAPMPGRIVAVLVAEGEVVTRGTRLIVLEAMKMEQALTAPFDGIVAEVKVEAGQQVREGLTLARIEEQD